MENGPNFASVTNVPCTGNHLQRSADDPLSAIQFDPETAEYQIVSRSPDGKKVMTTVIYHCPFCGGAAPKSKRHLLFALISHEEESRLGELLKGVQTLEDAMSLLGKPDRDQHPTIYRPEREDEAPTVQRNRVLVYTQLSDVAEIHISEKEGRMNWYLQGKYVGKKQP